MGADLSFEIAFDERTGAHAYSYHDGIDRYVIGIGLRTISPRERISQMLDSAARTGMFSFGHEVRFLEEGEQNRIADEGTRQDLVGSVIEERGLDGRYLLQAVAAPLDEPVWQKLTIFYGIRDVFGAFVAHARENDALRAVGYPIRSGQGWERSLARGARFEHGSRSGSLDRFLDHMITLTTHALETDPRKASAPLTSSPSYVFEREVASRVFGSN